MVGSASWGVSTPDSYAFYTFGKLSKMRHLRFWQKVWCYFLLKYDFVYLGKWGPQHPECLGSTATRVLREPQPPECCSTRSIQSVMWPRASRVFWGPQHVECHGAHSMQNVVGPTASRALWGPEPPDCCGARSLRTVMGPRDSKAL